jgi:ankyrin repeat protein
MDSCNELLNSCRKGDLQKVQSLVESGADVNARDNTKEGYTALFEAIVYHQPEVVKYLVEHGADIEAKVHYWYDSSTPLMLASYKGAFEVVKYLIEQGADVNAKSDILGQTALLNAASAYGRIDLVRYLVEHGAEVNTRTQCGRSVLMYVRDIEVCKYLVENGADVNARDNNGITLLMWSSSRRTTEYVKYLIEQGADVNAVDDNGNTALMWASGNWYRDEIVKILCEHGATEIDLAPTEHTDPCPICRDADT